MSGLPWFFLWVVGHPPIIHQKKQENFPSVKRILAYHIREGFYSGFNEKLSLTLSHLKMLAGSKRSPLITLSAQIMACIDWKFDDVSTIRHLFHLNHTGPSTFTPGSVKWQDKSTLVNFIIVSLRGEFKIISQTSKYVIQVQVLISFHN